MPRTAILVLIICALVAQAVDRSKFKKCEQNSFCLRQRNFKSGILDYQVVPGSFDYDGTSLKVSLHEPRTNTDYVLQIARYPDGIVRLRMNEKNPLHPRYVPQDVLLESLKMVPFQDFTEKEDKVILTVGETTQFIMTKRPLRFDLVVDGEPVVSANSEGLLYIEHLREKKEEPVSNAEAQSDPEQFASAEWDIGQHVDMSNAWSESFGGHTEQSEKGPQSIGMDISFVGADNVYGIPEHATDLALKSTTGDGAEYSEPYRLYNFDVFEYEIDEPMALYGAVPMMVGHSQKHTAGVFWFNTAETYIDVSKPSGKLFGSLFGGNEVATINTHWFSETGIIDVFFFSGPKPKDVFRQFSSVVGTQELPPIFAVAYHQCRWNYQDEQDVHGVNQKFEEHNIPYDVLWLDIEHTDGKRYFTWDGKSFPTSVRMLDDLESYGRRMVTIIDPHIKRDSNYHIHTEATSLGYYVKNEEDGDYEGHCWPGSSSWVDYTNPSARNWWATKLSYDSYKGSTDSLFVWNDMNEPSVFNGPEVTMRKSARHYRGWEHRDVHNVYGMLMQRATAEGLVQRNPVPHRSFVLSRAFYAGTQRHGAIWTGDNTASWTHLAASQPMIMSMGIAGIVFSGADVGGFFGNPEPDLLTRWYQAGTYQPFFRAHAHLDTRRREPWLIDQPYFQIIEEAIRTRYHLLPYLYTSFYQAFIDNTPVMRPLWVEYPTDKATFKIQDSFLLGSDLLVTPVIKKDQASVEVYLPEHPTELWYDVDTYEVYTPKQTITIATPLEKTPVLQRGGSIIPRKMRVRRSTVAMLNDPYTLYVAPDSKKAASGDLYLDDTITFQFKDGVYAYRKFLYTQEGKKAVLRSIKSNYPESKEGGSYKSSSTVERVIIAGMKTAPQKVLLSYEGKKTGLSFLHDTQKNIVTVKKPGCLVDRDWEITVSFA